MRMRDIINLMETNTSKSFVGTCVNSFDDDGDCIVPELGWTHVSDLAIADEDATPMTPAAFRASATIPAQITAATKGHEIHYLVAENGVLMLYDADDDIHYLFA